MIEGKNYDELEDDTWEPAEFLAVKDEIIQINEN
jgi:hypothetical protein